MVVGAVVGVVGGYALSVVMHRLPLPSGALYPVQILLGAGAIAEIERFHSSLASLAEIVAFTMLGLTVSLTELTRGNAWLVGLALAVLLALVVRPVLVGLSCCCPST
jgi:potassium/hydrogen antiporter